MLVLLRRKDESITIGKDIKVTVVAIRGNHVQLGIDAPKEVPIERSDMKKRKGAHDAE